MRRTRALPFTDAFPMRLLQSERGGWLHSFIWNVLKLEEA